MSDNGSVKLQIRAFARLNSRTEGYLERLLSRRLKVKWKWRKGEVKMEVVCGINIVWDLSGLEYRLEDISIVDFFFLSSFWMNIKQDIRRINVKREGNLWIEQDIRRMKGNLCRCNTYFLKRFIYPCENLNYFKSWSFSLRIWNKTKIQNLLINSSIIFKVLHVLLWT